MTCMFLQILQLVRLCCQYSNHKSCLLRQSVRTRMTCRLIICRSLYKIIQQCILLSHYEVFLVRNIRLVQETCQSKYQF